MGATYRNPDGTYHHIDFSPGTYTCKCCGATNPIPFDEAFAQFNRLDQLDRISSACQWGRGSAGMAHDDAVLRARQEWDRIMAACSQFESRYC